MPNTSTVTTPQKGMMLDLHNISLTDGMYTYALNATLEQDTESGFVIQNDSSNILTLLFPEGFNPIGTLHILEQSRIIFFLANTKGESEIGEVIYKNLKFDTRPEARIERSFCVNCEPYDLVEPEALERTTQKPNATYRTIIKSNSLNLTREYSVKSTYKITDCTLEIYFVDGFNDDRYLYFNINEDDTLKVQDRFLTSGELDALKVLIQPKISRPILTVEDVFSGGALKQGVYQFFAAYSTAIGEPLSSYYGGTQPIPVFTKSDNDDNYVTDQAIKIRLDNVSKDTVYQFITIAVAETINNITEYKRVGTYPITQTNVVYTNGNQLPRITLDEILQKYPFYHHSNSITKSNDYLFRADLVEDEPLNLQRAANKIKLKWQTVVLREGDYKKPEIAQKYRSYMRDEVYPIGIVFEINGKDTPAFHIPGRIINNKDAEIIQGYAIDDVILEEDCNSIERNKRWQTYNTATIEQTPYQEYNSCSEAIYEIGEMAYWESGELYPDNKLIWGELAGKPIRHHKFPDNAITHIHENSSFVNELPVGVSFDTAFNEKLDIYPIGIKLDHDSVIAGLEDAVNDGLITMQQYKSITGYRIVRGNRVNNKSVVAKGYLSDMWSYVKDAQTYYYQNYPYNDLNTDHFIARNNHYRDKKVPYLNEFTPSGRYTFFSPDTQFTEPPLGSVLKLEVESFGKTHGYFSEALDQSKQRLLTDQAYKVASVFGASIANDTKLNDATESAASNLGATIGGAVGTAAGPLGTVLGTVAGSLLGGLFANNMFEGPFQNVAAAMTKMALALYNSDKLVTFFKFLMPPSNHHYQYNSVANFNNYMSVLNDTGQKIRPIETYAYLRPEITSVAEKNNTVLINNYNRESAVYIKITKGLQAPYVFDNSRFTLSQVDNCEDYDKVRRKFVRTAAWYYASIKNNLINQYGNVYDIEYLETNSISYSTTNDKYKDLTILNGDIFINRYAFKRKHSFFTASTFNLPEGTDFYYSDFANVGYPTYYYNSQGNEDFYLPNPYSFFNVRTSGLGIPLISPKVVAVPEMTLGLEASRKAITQFDCKRENKIQQKGVQYLYSYGIPNVFVESDINLDFRKSEGSKEKDFYPKQQNLDYWLQEKNVSPREDNYFLYDKTFSKQNKENFIRINTPLYQPDKKCATVYPNRVIYSLQSSEIDSNNNKDSWLVNKANNYYDFTKTNGKLISVSGIENDKVLARFENTSEVYNAYVTLQSNSSNIQVDTGGMFQTKPQEYAHTELGYAGSQHKAILHTEFGHVTVDAKRGQVFVIKDGIQEISKDGMKNWFARNLPFEIEKTLNVPNHILDNPYYGVGLILYYDRIYKRLFITKLDYKPLKENMSYYEGLGFFFKNIPVSLKDPEYFEDLSWTVSYNFYTKTWVSFHSFKPNYAVSTIDFFLTGVNNNTFNKGISSLWAHSVTNRSFQVYYGKKYPFIIETFSKPDGKQHIYSNIEYNADLWLFNDNLTRTRLKGLPFNKYVVYTDRASSGLLEGNIVKANDVFGQMSYPKEKVNATEIEVINKESNWKFNQFRNIQKGNVPLWVQKTDKKLLNGKALSYGSTGVDNYPIRGEWCRVQLINDKWTNYKIIMKWLINYSTQSIY